MEFLALLRVGEIFGIKDLEFPVFLNDGEDRERVIVQPAAIDDIAHARHLDSSYAL